MKKFFNIRPIFILFLSLMFGIFFAYQNLLDNKTFTIILTAMLIVLMLYFIVKIRHISINKILLFSMVIISICIGYSGFNINLNNFKTTDITNANISGYIETEKLNTNYSYFILNNVSINSKRINKNIFVYSNTVQEEAKVGSYIDFTADLSAVELFEDNEFNSYYYNNNISYKTTINYSIQNVDYSPKIATKIKLKVKSLLYDNFTYENASIGYAVLFGDSSLISKDDYVTFQNIGVSHIFAVSGLHISILLLVLAFIFKKMKIPKSISIILTGILALFYAYICDFSPSIVRASIMALLLLIASKKMKQSDSLNALSLSGLIILLISPLSLLTVGFQLSFLAVGSILCLSKPLTNLFDHFLPRKLSQVLAVTFSAQIGTGIVLSQMYDWVNILSFLSNIIVIPIFTIYYILLLISVLVTFLLPFLNFVCALPNFIMFAIKSLANILNSYVILNISTLKINLISSIFIIFLIFVVSYFFIGSKKSKKIIASVLAILIVVSVTITSLPYNFDNKIIACQTDDAYYFVAKEDGESVLFINSLNEENILQIYSSLKNNNIYKINNIITHSYKPNETTREYLDKINSNVIEVNSTTFEDFITKEYLDFNIRVLDNSSSDKYCLVEFENINIMFEYSSIGQNEIDSINNYYSKPIDYVFSNTFNLDLYNNFNSHFICRYGENTSTIDSLQTKKFFTIML